MQEAKGLIRTVATAQDPTLVRCFRGHEKTVNAVSFSPDMKQVASGSSDGMVYVWSFKPQIRPFKFVGHVGPVNDVVFTNNGQRIISCGDDRQIRFWRNSVQSKCTSIKAHSGPILSLTVSQSPQSSLLLSCSSDKSLKMFSLSGKFKQSYLGHTNWVRQCQVSPDQRVMLSCSDDRTVKLWDLETSKTAVTFSDHKEAVYCGRFSPDGTCVAAGARDGAIKVWDVRSNKLIQHYNGHAGAVNQLAFHPYGYHMASVGDDGKIKVWELKHGRLGWTLYGHNDQIRAVNFSQKGDYFVTGAADSLVMIWRSNFDQGLIVPQRNQQMNFIEKEGQTVQPLFKSNKIIGTGDIHKQHVPRFGGAKSQSLQDSTLQPSSQAQNPRSKNLSQIMSSGLQKLVNQLDTVTKVIGSLDQRISNHQKTIQQLFDHPKVTDYFAMLQEQEKMRPEIYNSVWEAYRNANLEGAEGELGQHGQQHDFDDIEADLERLNKHLSEKKLQAIVGFEEKKALEFREELDKELEFDAGEIEEGLQLHDF